MSRDSNVCADSCPFQVRLAPRRPLGSMHFGPPSPFPSVPCPSTHLDPRSLLHSPAPHRPPSGPHPTPPHPTSFIDSIEKHGVTQTYGNLLLHMTEVGRLGPLVYWRRRQRSVDTGDKNGAGRSALHCRMQVLMLNPHAATLMPCRAPCHPALCSPCEGWARRARASRTGRPRRCR